MRNRRPYAPLPSNEQAKFIDRLGGPKAVASHISEHLRLTVPLTPQAVSMWKKRGIPYRYRPLLIRRAAWSGIYVPPGFQGDEPVYADPGSIANLSRPPRRPPAEAEDDVPGFLRQA